MFSSMTLYQAIAVKAAMVIYMLGDGRICSPVTPLFLAISPDASLACLAR